MYRVFNVKTLYNTKLNGALCNSANTRSSTFPTYFCSYCQNALHFHNFTKNGLELTLPNVRHGSTRALLMQGFARKKIKNRKKYVELLEVNDSAMTQTKAAVSKLGAKDLSKLTDNPKVSLSQLHMLKSSKAVTKQTKVSEAVDMELLRLVENNILHNRSQSNDLKEDDCAIIFTSATFSKLKTFGSDYETMSKIKDSYDKFRRETVRSQKMKDLIFAIDEGVNQNLPFTTDSLGDLGRPMGAQHTSKGAHQLFREYLSECRQILNLETEYDSKISNHFLEFNDRGMALPSSLDILEEEELHEHVDPDTAVPAGNTNDNVKHKTSTKPTAKSVKLKNKSKDDLLKEKEAKARADEMNAAGREDSLNKLLAAHLEICESIGAIDKASKILLHYRTRGKKSDNHPKITNVKLFNIILHGYASKGNYNKLTEILSFMNEDSIMLDLQSYAAIFECIENSEIPNKLTALNQHWSDHHNRDMSLQDLIQKCKLTNRQRLSVVAAVRRIEPDVYNSAVKLVKEYDCPLLNHLNAGHGSLASSSPAKGLLDCKILKDQTQAQIDHEKLGIIKIGNIENNGEPSQNTIYYRGKLKECEENWRLVIHDAFLRNLSTLKAQCNASQSALNILPYLQVLKVDDYVELLMYEINKLADGSETYSPSVRVLQRELGLKVHSRYQILKNQKNGVMDKIVKLYDEYCQWYIDRESDSDAQVRNGRQKWQQLMEQHSDGASLDLDENQWPHTICIGVGKFLYNILINEIKIDINIFKKNSKKSKCLPILYSVYRSHAHMLRQELKPHPLLARLVRESAPPSLCMEATLLPTLCPPLPWTHCQVSQGGYLLTKTPLMRMPMTAVQQIQRLHEAPMQSLYPALDSLNQLAAVPWRINQPILDVLLQVFRSGGSRELCVARPARAVTAPPPAAASLSRRERALALRKHALLARTRQEMHSLWCDSLYKLSLANHFRDEIFWLPHNMDFRGRVYPCPPHLSHLGADAARSVLVFAVGKPLGPQGLRWLKLHAVNLTGTMKRSTIQERLEYAETILDDILDSADNPLEGRKWWAKSEEPWQTLACCMEIAKAVRSPNPEEYVCHFPVHQDGSCNGLQHYAALGGDSAGAFSVNLATSDRPQDVYSAVATLVEGMRVSDAAAGDKIAQLLEGYVRRKVIKQTVMTTVYGVTRFGARLQIAKQLKDIDEFPKEQVWPASSYLTRKTFESIQEMFTSTKEIQDWFTECAKLISGVCGYKVEWVTPLGLPVVQPYYKHTKSQYSSKGKIMEYTSCDQYEKPCVIKQKNAFPPNFIHSLDSSHMMLTSVHSEAEDLTFVSVHDCFWTHPCTVEIMNKICREQFVALHSQPILEDLSKYLSQRYTVNDNDLLDSGSVSDTSKRKLNGLLKKLPKKGDFDLSNVLKSIYFFS